MRKITRRRFLFYLIGVAASLSWVKYFIENIRGGSSVSEFNDTRTGATPPARVEPEKEAMFYEKAGGGKVRCRLCFRECLVPEGERGFCRNRQNTGGRLYTLVYSRPSAVNIDPVEKEPQHHFLPGTEMLCFGTAGCNFRCRHCHNWHLSQRSIEEVGSYMKITPQAAVNLAVEKNIPTVSFTYNDPISFYEYVYDTARIARRKGVRVLFHSNGSFRPDPLRELLKYTDAVTIDIKGFSEKAYDNSEARLDPVLESLKIIGLSGVWLELVNLIIPGLNDSADEIRRMCRWIKDNLGPEIPLHFSRFSPAYRLTHLPRTPVSTLEEAFRIASEEGLEYVSIGNLPGHRRNSTFCPACGNKLIERVHFEVRSNRIRNGKCPGCGHKIPGVWE